MLRYLFPGGGTIQIFRPLLQKLIRFAGTSLQRRIRRIEDMRGNLDGESVVKLQTGAESQVSKDRGRHDFVGLRQIVPRAEQADVFGNDAAAAAGERNVVVVVQIVV